MVQESCEAVNAPMLTLRVSDTVNVLFVERVNLPTVVLAERAFIIFVPSVNERDAEPDVV
jgi:hypothetical protein